MGIEESTIASTEQHVYHHSEPTEPRVNVSVERNSRGFNVSATVVGARTPGEALDLLRITMKQLSVEYGEKAAA